MTAYYISTRGQAPVRDFADTLLAGLAEDGGLYLPQAWPSFSTAEFRALRGLDYADLAARVIAPFVEGAFTVEELTGLTKKAYAGFRHAAIAPLVQLSPSVFVLELFHGPTLAFKDMAMQLLGHLFEAVLTRAGKRITIVGATSGDTGSAAIEAMRGRRGINLVILHPHGRTSEVQRRQMTTVIAPNIKNIAIDGTFDDCQDMVKAMFADSGFRNDINLSAVNSINWARIAAQIPYYIAAGVALGAPDRDISVAVPTGNFGNVLAAWGARKMGLPVVRAVVAANRNDILARFLESNDMSMRAVEPSLSPSMDIQVSSNFERLLFELLGRDPVKTAIIMQDFRATGRMAVPQDAWQAARALFVGHRLSDGETLAEIKNLYTTCGYLADPHSAIGIHGAAAHALPGVPVIAAATAHPAKFPDAIMQATGLHPALPPALADLYERAEAYDILPNNLARVQEAVRNFALRNAA
jgi:threonine synthase